MKVKHLSLLLLAAATLGCKKEQAVQQAPAASQKMQSYTQGSEDVQTVLGSKIANPYTLAIMTQAKQNLANRGIHPINSFTVRATHRYVKFSPANEQQLNIIAQDTTIHLRDCPIDYAKVVDGGWYRQPGLPDSVPTPQYTAVRAKYQFAAQVPYLIIENLYLPEEDTQLMGTNLRGDYTYLFHLLNEAYTIASGSNTNTIGSTTTEYFIPATPYTFDEYGGSGSAGPNGRIQIFDTRLNRNIAMEGVKITANRWFTTHKAYTNADGDYWLDGSFDRVADYAITFERKGFTIARNRFQRARIRRSDIADNHWSHTIVDGYDRLHGHMFRGAYRYYFKDNGGLSRPVWGNGWQVVIISASESSHFWGSGINLLIAPFLFVAPNDEDEEPYESDEIFSTTVHELAHTAHLKKLFEGPILISQVTGTIRESWAVGVEWLLTGIEYRELGVLNYGDRTYNPTPAPQFPNQFAYQYWNSATFGESYTNLFINLIDDFNENGVNLRAPVTPAILGTVNDPVTGYTMPNLENMLTYSRNKSTFATKLKASKPAGVTDAQIDALLSNY